MHKNIFSSHYIVSSTRQFRNWLRSAEHKTERIKAGNALLSFAPLLFVLHLFFRTHYEPGIFMDGSFHLGYQTTLLTFAGIALLPYILFSQISSLSMSELAEILAQWAMALAFSVGNILLLSTYLIRRKLRHQDFRKKSIVMVVVCITVAFFSPDLRTFYFGSVLWLAAFIVLLAGLLLIHSEQQNEVP